MIGEIYKYKRINKIEFKKNNSAGHIIIDNSKVESAISKKNIPLNVKCKPNTVTNNVLHTPSSTGIIEGGKSFEFKHFIGSVKRQSKLFLSWTLDFSEIKL